MSAIERICGKCGHSNPLDRVSCAQCGTALLEQRPARVERALTVRWARTGTALAVGGAMALRLGRLLWRNRTHLARLNRSLRALRDRPEVLARPAAPRVTVHRLWAWGDRDGLRHWSVERWHVERHD